MSKTDKNLGYEISIILRECGIETPMEENNLTAVQKKKRIAKKFAEIMEILELDLSDDSLAGTPDRVAKMYVDEIFYGLDYDNFPKCTAVENKMRYKNILIEKNINVQSNCEHHFVVIDGRAHIGYIPNEKVIGLSKINRIVEFFAKRPQIQERLTEQIFYALEYILETSDIAVVIDAQHYCVKSRGIQDVNSSTITSKVGGIFFENESARKEFFDLIK